jgi:hypothetical protein
MGVKEELAQRLEFLGITPAEIGRLRALGPVLEEALEPVAADFYRHLLFFPETRHLLREGEIRERLIDKQREYLRSLAGAPLDEAYVEERRRIGEVHEDAGVPPGWHLGAYAHLFADLVFMIEDAVHGDLEEFRLIVVALMRRILLDAQLSVEAHVQRREQRLEFLNEERAREIDRQIDLIFAEVETVERYVPYVPIVRESTRLIRERAARITAQLCEPNGKP